MEGTKKRMKTEKIVKKQIVTWLCIFCMLVSSFGNLAVVWAAEDDQMTESVSREKSVDWILSRMAEDGSFGDARLINDTCDAAAFMKLTGMDVLESSVEWITEKVSQTGNNNDVLARAYVASGNTEFLTELLQGQNPDGGFGLTRDFMSDPLDSMLALNCLAGDVVQGISHEEELFMLSGYFTGIQNPDGGFGYTADSGSDYGLSIKIALAAAACEIQEKNLPGGEWTKALESYIETNAPSYDENSFWNAEFMLYQLIKEKTAPEEGMAWIMEHQEENGSFAHDFATTLSAAYLMQVMENRNRPYFYGGELDTLLSSYVLYDGFATDITADSTFSYKTNREQTGKVVTECMRDGKVVEISEQEILLVPENVNTSIQSTLSVTGEKEGSYAIRVSLYVGEQLFGMTEDVLKVQAPFVDDLILSTENAGESAVVLQWNDISNEFYRYGYRIYRQTEEKEWETRSSWDGEEKVRVLNVYPVAWSRDILKNWMETTVSGEDVPAGKGLFLIDTVYIDDYNRSPEKYLKDENGNYKYDVLFFGASDTNSGKDLNEISYQVTKKFAESGRGILFGHDTVTLCAVVYHPYFARFSEMMGAKLIYGNGVESCNTVKVVNTGFLTSYPWKIDGVLKIPYAHALEQYTGGTTKATVWMEFTSGGRKDPGTGGRANAYLFTHNQMAMIQTGHSNGQATDDERKILANTLFYLKQLTHETRMEDKSATDITSPVINEISEITWEGENLNLIIDSKDFGTCYRYYVEGIPEQNDTEALRKQSNRVTAEVTAGILGYEVLADTSSMDVSDWTNSLLIECMDGNLSIPYEAAEGQQEYLHIRAVDSAGNRSAERVIEIPENRVQEDCFASGYGLFGATDVTAYVQELRVEQDVYSGGNLTCAGSGITILGNASTVGQMNLYTGSRTITGQEEQVQALEMPQLHEAILVSMGGTENLDVLNAYESTQIDYPTWCMTTTGAYCPGIKLNASLMCDNTINIGADSVECGGEKNVALYSVNGDININASSLTGCGLIYAPNGNITINVQNMEFTGSIIAKRITIQGSMIHIGQPESRNNETVEESITETETKEWENSQENINDEE